VKITRTHKIVAGIAVIAILGMLLLNWWMGAAEPTALENEAAPAATANSP
jgi:hypothetical protein